MKYLKTFEVKTGFINFSDLGDNWSAQFHLDPNINYYKKQFKIRGRKEVIKTIISNVKTIGESNYNSVKSEAKSKFNINLPEYKRAIWG